MKLLLRQISHEASPAFRDLLAERLASLSKNLQIDEARITIERLESSPPFRMTAHLVTPGPDVSAEATDHTLRAALQKLVDQLRMRISHRNQKRDRRAAEAVVSGGGAMRRF